MPVIPRENIEKYFAQSTQTEGQKTQLFAAFHYYSGSCLIFECMNSQEASVLLRPEIVPRVQKALEIGDKDLNAAHELELHFNALERDNYKGKYPDAKQAAQVLKAHRMLFNPETARGQEAIRIINEVAGALGLSLEAA